MASNLFRFNVQDVVSAVVSAVIVSVVGYLGTLTNIMDADWSQILNVAFLAGVASLLKAMGTDANGNFGGVIKIK